MKETWRVTWGLEIFQEPDDGIPQLNAPDSNCFRLSFASREEAALFRAEIQRYMGDAFLRLLELPHMRIQVEMAPTVRG